MNEINYLKVKDTRKNVVESRLEIISTGHQMITNAILNLDKDEIDEVFDQNTIGFQHRRNNPLHRHDKKKNKKKKNPTNNPFGYSDIKNFDHSENSNDRSQDLSLSLLNKKLDKLNSDWDQVPNYEDPDPTAIDCIIDMRDISQEIYMAPKVTKKPLSVMTSYETPTETDKAFFDDEGGTNTNRTYDL